MMRSRPCVIMRGGTSKGLFFHERDMPQERSVWPAFLLDAMGSPDLKQIDGMGGANSLTSKVAIIKRSDAAGVDVDYTFAQVSIAESTVDFRGNCGNISSAVGPFAIDEGLVAAEGPVASIRIRNTNTQKLIVAQVEVEEGRAKVDGACRIPGVPHAGSPVYLSFHRPQGAVTGKTLPTGNPVDTVEVSIGKVRVSIVDAANPLVFVEARSVGLKGTELPGEFTARDLKVLEEIRSAAAELCGFAAREQATSKSPAVPKLTIIAGPERFTDSSGQEHGAEEMDLLIRMMSMQKPHNALALTGAVCTTVAAFTAGTLPAMASGLGSENLRLGHPSGIMRTSVGRSAGEIEYVTGVRTARRLLEGRIYTKGAY